MNESITLKNEEYQFQVINNILMIRNQHGEYWRCDRATRALFAYALAVQGELANLLCDCDYLLPSKNANDPTVHKENCPFRTKIKELKNE